MAADPVLAARVERTSRAFAVTEAYQKFDAIRRTLAAVNTEGLGSDDTAIALKIGELLKSADDLRAKSVAAAEGPTPAMTAIDLTAFLRNDPVPRLLWLAGQRDPASPRRILTAAGLAADQRMDWWAMADLLAARQTAVATDLIANGSFVESGKQSQAPRFLYPHSGVLPAKWTWRAMPTERGKVERVDSEVVRGGRALRVEGAWDTQFYQWIPAEPKGVYVATALLRGKSGPGNDTALFLTFLNRSGEVTGTVRACSLPKGLTSGWRVGALADRVPEDAAWVGVGVASSRQGPEDWLEATAVSLQRVSFEKKREAL